MSRLVRRTHARALRRDRAARLGGELFPSRARIRRLPRAIARSCAAGSTRRSVGCPDPAGGARAIAGGRVTSRACSPPAPIVGDRCASRASASTCASSIGDARNGQRLFRPPLLALRHLLRPGGLLHRRDRPAATACRGCAPRCCRRPGRWRREPPASTPHRRTVARCFAEPAGFREPVIDVDRVAVTYPTWTGWSPTCARWAHQHPRRAIAAPHRPQRGGRGACRVPRRRRSGGTQRPSKCCISRPGHRVNCGNAH